MNKKLNKKLLNLITLCSGITATVAVGIGGVVYSLRQEKNGGDEPVDQKVLPESVYNIDENNVLLGFKDEFLNDPDSEIYKDNFQDCDTMQIPAHVTSIASQAFERNKVPSFIKNLTFEEGSHCSSIAEDAFKDCSSLTSVDLSKCTELRSMEWYTFYNCSSLNSVKIPNNLTEIPDDAFGSCSALISVDFSNATSLSSINSCAFEYCSSLTSVSLPESLKKIGVSAFWHCPLLRSINFPRNLTSIGNSVFVNCSSLTSVSFPSSLESIGMFAFGECSNLSSITWDRWTGSVDSLENSAFSGVCPTGGNVIVTNPSDGHDSDALLQYLLEYGGLPESWAKVIPLPEEVYKISENNVLIGFREGIDLYQYDGICNTIQIPARVTSIGTSAFLEDIPSFITKLTFAEGSVCGDIYNHAFRNCTALTSADFSNCLNLSSIQSNDFSGCSSLNFVNFPSSLKGIAQSAFRNCSSLKYIAWDLPNDYQNEITIGKSAFANISPSGKVESLNSQITSQELLEWIKTKGGFPTTGWDPVN